MKRVVTAVVLALLASTALTTGTASGQDTGGSGTVKGKATLNKKGVADATVVLRPGDANATEDPSLTAQTSSKGSYKITNVPPGTYKVELTTSVDPPKGVVGANVNCKIKSYSISATVGQETPTETGPRPANFVVVEVTQNKAVSVKAGRTKTVNVGISCPSGTTIAESGSSAGP